MSKCSFGETKIDYLGYTIDAEGLHTSKAKIEAIQKMKKPTNVTEVKAFLGIINYYGKFIANLSA